MYENSVEINKQSSFGPEEDEVASVRWLPRMVRTPPPCLNTQFWAKRCCEADKELAVCCPESFQLAVYFLSVFMNGSSIMIWSVFFSLKPFIKIKTKQNNKKNSSGNKITRRAAAATTTKLSGHSLEQMGARGWENIPAALTTTSVEGIQGPVCLVVWEVWSAVSKCSREKVWHELGREPRLAKVQTLSFPLTEVSGPNSWKIGWAGSPLGVSLRHDVQDSHEWSSSAKKGGGWWAAGARQPAWMCVLWKRSGSKSVQVEAAGEKRKKGGLFLKVTFWKWALSQHTLLNPKKHGALYFLGSSPPRGKKKKNSSQNLSFDDVISTAD